MSQSMQAELIFKIILQCLALSMLSYLLNSTCLHWVFYITLGLSLESNTGVNKILYCGVSILATFLRDLFYHKLWLSSPLYRLTWRGAALLGNHSGIFYRWAKKLYKVNSGWQVQALNPGPHECEAQRLPLCYLNQ